MRCAAMAPGGSLRVGPSATRPRVANRHFQLKGLSGNDRFTRGNRSLAVAGGSIAEIQPGGQPQFCRQLMDLFSCPFQCPFSGSRSWYSFSYPVSFLHLIECANRELTAPARRPAFSYHLGTDLPGRGAVFSEGTLGFESARQPRCGNGPSGWRAGKSAEPNRPGCLTDLGETVPRNRSLTVAAL